MRTALIVLLIATLAFSGALAFKKSPLRKQRINFSEKQSVVKTLLKQQTIQNTVDYTTKYFANQLLDHFNFNNTQTFTQRYLEKVPANWNMTTDPVFIYMGNEGDIVDFYTNSGFLAQTLYEKFNARILFIEHRYFGTTQPFGTMEASYTIPNLVYLTVEQALADYVLFLNWYKRDILNCVQDDTCPTMVSFGGSYGGMLAAWMRMKFPNVIDLSIASSAPLLLFRERQDFDSELFNHIATTNYQKQPDVPLCADMIREGYRRLSNYASSNNASQYPFITQYFNVCAPITSAAEIGYLQNSLTDTYSSTAQFNYPYPTNFSGVLPAWPVNASCAFFQDLNNKYDTVEKLSDIPDSDLFVSMYKAQEILNGNGCMDLDQSAPLVDINGWSVLACQDMAMPMSQDGVNDMFNPLPFNYTSYTQQCQQQFGVTPTYDWALDYYGGKTDYEMSQYSRIFFFNGELDPWHAGGLLETVSDSMIAHVMPDCAHHLDLRLPNPLDPQGVIDGRNLEIQYLTKWLAEVAEEKAALKK